MLSLVELQLMIVRSSCRISFSSIFTLINCAAHVGSLCNVFQSTKLYCICPSVLCLHNQLNWYYMDYLLKNSQAVKKGAALCKIASMEKFVKYRWRPRNGCDGKSMTIFFNSNSGEFVLSHPRNWHKICLNCCY